MQECPHCGAPMDDGDMYCADCGMALHEQETAEEPSCPEASRAVETAAATVRPAAASKSSARRAVLCCLAALALLIFAASLLMRFLQSRSPGVHTARSGTETEASAPVLSGSPSGLFLLSAYGWDGGSGTQAPEDWYLIFNGDGTGSARLFEHSGIGFTYTPSRIVLEDGSSLPYQLEGDTVTVRGGTTLVFVRAEAEPAAITPTPEPGSLQLNSRWTGLLEISGHKGEGSLEDGRIEVWGYLGESESGMQSFELYRAEDKDGKDPLLSMWVNVYGDHMVPVIGEHDAWLFDRWLQASDTKALTLYYRSNSIRCTYRYRLGQERCSISFRVAPDQP